MTSKTLPTNAAEIHERLQLLRLERAIAGAAELADIDDDIDATRTAYVGAAVTEIASLRAELSGVARG